MSDPEIQVFLIIDFEPLRVGLGLVAAREPGLAISGSARTFRGAPAERSFAEADVVVVDLDSLEYPGSDAEFAKLIGSHPGLKLLFLGEIEGAMEIPFETLQALLRVDTFGFVHKRGSIERVHQAIQLVAKQVFVCESDVIKHVLTRLLSWASQPASGPFGELSARETEVLTRVAQGRSNREIARDLFVSEGTVKAHVSHIMGKLDVDRRTELVRHAIARGMVLTSDD